MYVRYARSLCLVCGVLLHTLPPALADSPEASVPLGAEYERYRAPADADLGEDAPGRAPEPRGELSLRQALGAALLYNPALAASSWEIRSREARTLQAGLLPNPTLDVEVENIGGSGSRESFEQAETTIQLSQLVLIGGKRAKRRALADLRSELARWDYEVGRIEVLTSTTKAFIALLTSQRRLELLVELESVAAAAVDTLTAQVRAGAAPAVARTRAEVVQLSVELERRQAERAVAARRIDLAAAWGSPNPVFDGLIGDLSSGVVAPPPLAELSERVESNPELARWATEVAEREASLALEKAGRLPDPTVRLAGRYFSDNDDGALVAGVSIPLPIFDRNQGNALAATREVYQARADKQSVEVLVRSSLARRYQDLLAAFEQADALRRTTLPVARRAFEGTSDGYRKGIFRYLDVLDAQRTLYDLRARELDALSTYHQARAEIERLLGAPITEGDSES